MSRRAAMWGAAALSVVLVLLFSAVLFQPTLGSNANASNDGGMTVESPSAMPTDDDTWYEDEDEHDDEGEGRYEEHERGDDDD